MRQVGFRRLSTPQHFTKLCHKSYVSSENSLINSTVFYYVILKLFIKTFLQVLLQEDIGNVLKVRSSGVQKKEGAETDLKISKEKTKTISNLF